MSLPALSVRRPITVLMAALAVAVFGQLALERLPVELLPDLSYPTLTVQTTYPDAAPVSVEQFVTRPIEEAVGVIQGVRDMRSTSRAGVSEVVLEFDWARKMDFAALDVREKLGLVELPREAETPRVLRYDPALDPIVRLGLSGDRDLGELRELGERWLRPRLEAIPGVAAVRVRGGLEAEIVVEADEGRLAALGLTLEDVGRALRSENVNRPGGVLKDWGAVYLVRTLHEFDTLEAIRRTVVREAPRGRVRVEDVAHVFRGHRDRETISRAGGQEIVELALHKEGNANTVEVAQAIREALEPLQEELSDDLRLELLGDQSRYIADAIRLVWSAALVGGMLAILVLYFFLRDLPSTLIVALTIPVSVVAAFLPMHALGVSLNIMSLGGLALGVGMLVDNSIVVLEAIDRRRRAGAGRRDAARLGAGEVAGAVTAATLTTISVFVPIVFVRGVAGQLFYDLAVTVCLSLAASLIVSLSLIPSLAGLGGAGGVGRSPAPWRWAGAAPEGVGAPWSLGIGRFRLPPVGDGVHGISRALTLLFLPLRIVLLVLTIVAALLGRGLDGLFRLLTWPFRRAQQLLEQAYPGLLAAALRGRGWVLGLALGLFVLSLGALPRLGTDLIPELSQGEFSFVLRLPEGTPLSATADVVRRIEEPLVDDGGVRFTRLHATVGSVTAAGSGRQRTGENLAQLHFTLPRPVRPEQEQRAVARVREVLRAYPAVAAELVRPSVLTMRPAVEVNVFSDDLAALDRASRTVLDALGGIPGVVDLASTAEAGSPEVRIEPDRERAGALGVQAETLALALRRHIRGEVLGQFREAEQRLDIRLRAGESSRDRAAEIGRLPLRLADGTIVPVSAVARVAVEQGPAAIHRADGARVARVTGKASLTDLGATLGAVRERLNGLVLPPGAVAEVAGQQEELSVSLGSLRLALALALFLVYVVMAMQFESLIHPLVILLTAPLGAVGVVGTLLLTRTPVSVLVLIGAVMLAGIVVNNAIVMVDAINRRRRQERQTLDEALSGAGRERLRPILMTTTTTVLALLPMALGLGAGDELRAPLAITVIGGLTAATLLTLVVVPCTYRLVSREQRAAAIGEPEEAIP